MPRTYKFLSVLALLILILFAFATPTRAFESRNGENVVIAAGETIPDDLYAFGATVTLDGTVKGDLVVAAQTITINGTVEGDLLAAGQTIIINGTVTDDVRAAGSVLYIGEAASIADDLVAAGYSLENRAGSMVGGDVLVGAGQVLLAGEVAGDVKAGTGGLKLSGSIGGDVKADVGEAEEGYAGPPPTMFMGPSAVSVPLVPAGLTVDPSARIRGSLTYTSRKELSIPGSVVLGKVTHLEPELKEEVAKVITPAQQIGNWFLNLLRSIVTLVAIGLLLGWLFPKFVKNAVGKLQTKPWPSLGWGVVAIAAAIFAMLVVFLAMILLAVLFGTLTLGELAGTSVWLGILALFVLILGFVLAVSFVAKVVVGLLGGKLILNAIRPGLGEHRFWPLLLGVAIVAILVALPYVGGLLALLAVLFGLGALWLFGREVLAKKAA